MIAVTGRVPKLLIFKPNKTLAERLIKVAGLAVVPVRR